MPHPAPPPRPGRAPARLAAPVALTLTLTLTSCLSGAPEGLAPAPAARVMVKHDSLHRPLPDLPLPNDLATRLDPTSAMGRRINASMVAPTALEAHVRRKIAPQLFLREDAEGEPLRMNDQSWPPDLDRVAAPARAERMYFTLVVPRKEASARGAGAPTPVGGGRGHTGNRFDAINLGPYFARHGLATIAINK
ncbi:MAG: hypothetical protein FJ138_17580 [Deltaproteobacteria bacterium]|nr:hypothetical protein [Deltaproteobacteria bacterium]